MAMRACRDARTYAQHIEILPREHLMFSPHPPCRKKKCKKKYSYRYARPLLIYSPACHLTRFHKSDQVGAHAAVTIPALMPVCGVRVRARRVRAMLRGCDMRKTMRWMRCSFVEFFANAAPRHHDEVEECARAAASVYSERRCAPSSYLRPHAHFAASVHGATPLSRCSCIPASSLPETDRLHASSFHKARACKSSSFSSLPLSCPSFLLLPPLPEFLLSVHRRARPQARLLPHPPH